MTITHLPLKQYAIRNTHHPTSSMLKRVINRLSVGAAHDPASQPKPGGHGDHWGCIMRATDQDDLLSFISDVIREAERPEMFHAAGPAMAVQSPGAQVRARILVVNDKL